MLALLTPEEGITNLIEKLSKAKTNKDFLDQIVK